MPAIFGMHKTREYAYDSQPLISLRLGGCLPSPPNRGGTDYMGIMSCDSSPNEAAQHVHFPKLKPKEAPFSARYP